MDYIKQYTEGYRAAMGDYPNSRRPYNPYPAGSAENHEWGNGYQDGWNRAYMEHRWRGSKH